MVTTDDERAPRRHRRDGGGRPGGGAGKVAFVLSGGGNLGALQVGMLKALLEHRIVPDLIVGCSVGAINGAGLADDPTIGGVEHMERVWKALEGQNLLPSGWLPNAVALARKGEAVHDQAGLRAMAEEQLRSTTFDQLAVPFQCVATDILGVREVWFSEGPIVDAILASSALPAVYPAVEIDGVRYLDGGIVDDVPMSRAVELGATTIYVLQVGGFTRPRPEPQRPLDVAVQSYWIARHHRFKRELAGMPEGIDVHVLPAGETPKMRFNDFTQAGTLIEVAHTATTEYLDDREAGLPVPSVEEALASVEPGYEGSPPVVTDPGPAEGRWRRLTSSRHRTTDATASAGTTGAAAGSESSADGELPEAPGDGAATPAAEGNDHRRVGEMRQALRDRVGRSRHRRDAATVTLDVARWRRAVAARRDVDAVRPGPPPAPAAPTDVAAVAPGTANPGTATTTPVGPDTGTAGRNSAAGPGVAGTGTAAGRGSVGSRRAGTGTAAGTGAVGPGGAGTGTAAGTGAVGPGRTGTAAGDIAPVDLGVAARNGARSGIAAAGRTAAANGNGNGVGNGDGHAPAGSGYGVGARVARLLNRGDDA